MLVGRDRDRRVIEVLLAAARVGTSGVLVLSGEPGIGKTALLDDAVSHTEKMRLLRAQGIESEHAVPFAGLLQLLRPLVTLVDQLPPAQADALGSALLVSGRGIAEPTRFAVGAATLSLLSYAAEERPVAVLLDDAHLLDRPSVDAMVFAARRLVSDRLALVVATRAGEPGSQPWQDLPTRTLTGLDVEATGALVRSREGKPTGPDQTARLHRATAGNPLAILELAARPELFARRPADSPVPVSEALTRDYLGRFEDLGEDARLALLVASAASTRLTAVHLACRRLGLAGAPLTEAETAGLVTLEADRITFRHPLVRSAVYGAADPRLRREVHRALAAVTPPAELDRVAWHLAEGAVAPDEAAAASLDGVGRLASERGAYATAANAHERAAQLSGASEEVARRLTAAGQAAWLAGLTERAVALLDAALETAGEAHLRSLALELRGAVEARCGSLGDALTMLQQAAEATREADPARTVRLLADAIHVCFYLGDPRTALSISDQLEELLPRTDDPHAGFLGSMASGMAMVLEGSYGELGTQRIRDALELAGAEGPDGDPFRLPHRILAVLYLRETGTLRAVVDEAVAGLRERAALGMLPYLLMHLARDNATTDKWDDAEAGYLEGVRLARETGQTTDRAVSLAGLAWLYARQGRVAECRGLVAEAEGLCEAGHVRLGSAWLDFAQGDLQAGRGDLAGAVVHYERLRSRLVGAGLSDPDMSPVPELAEAYLHLGRREDAHAAAEPFERLAAAKGQPWSLARAARVRGLCAPDASAETCFLEALDLHARTPDRYETARTELAFGARLRRMRRRLEARPLLSSALATFEQLGADPWAEKAARELEATGQTAHRRRAGVIDELTPQERQISQLLARGMTTREAAAALFLSPKTVEYHLRHVYLKLAISSRESLTEVFGR